MMLSRAKKPETTMDILTDIGKALLTLLLFGALLFVIPTLFMLIFNIATGIDRNLDR